MSRYRIFAFTLAAILSYALSAPLFAADSSTEEVQRNLNSETESLRESFEKKMRDTLAIPEIIDETQIGIGPESASTAKFFAKKIVLPKSAVFSSQDFLKERAALENREISFDELRVFMRMVTDNYRSRGYVTSRAYITPQTVKDGQVEVSLLEGRVGKIRIEGNHYFSAATYEKPLEPLLKDPVFGIQNLEKALNFINQQPDRKAKALLLAGETPMTTDIILKVEDSRPLHIYYDFNNRGTRLTHHSRHVLHVDHNNITGRGDTLMTGFTLAEEGAIRTGQISYSFPIPETRTTLNLDTSVVDSMLVENLKPFEVKGESISFVPSIKQIFLENQSYTLEGVLALDCLDSKTMIDDLKTDFDRVRSIRLGPNLIFQDSGGRTILAGAVNMGLPNFLGSMDSVDVDASKPNAGGEFLYYTLNAVRIQRLTPWQSLMLIRAGGQWTRDTLVSAVQYHAGGASSVRGYPESDASGDYGYTLSTELIMPAFFIPKTATIPFSKKTWYETLKLTAFVDGGKTFIREKISEESVKDRFLLGAGFGFRFELSQFMSLELSFGFPLGDASSDKDRMQAHLAVRGGF